MRDAAHLVGIEPDQAAVGIAFRAKDAVEAIAYAVAFPAAPGGGNGNGPDDCVEAGRVATTCADRNTSNRSTHPGS
ncbi:hypothetical protein D9M68_874800 [compost metagenome]